MKHLFIFALAACVAVSSFGQLTTNNPNGQSFTDNFSSYSGSFSGWSNSNWNVDRRLTAGVTAGNYYGQSGVDFTTNSSNADTSANNYFYNIQGINRNIVDGSGNQAYIGPSWTVSASLYISQDMLTGNSEVDSELWARDNGLDSNNTVWYPGIGFTHSNLTDWWDLHGNPNEPGGYTNDSTFSTGLIIDNVYDPTFTNPYVFIPENNLSVGWHNFSITSTGHSWVFSFDGTQVYDANGSNYSSPGMEGLTRVFLENENFNDGGLNYAENPQTDVVWSNVAVTPEPAEILPFALGLLGLVCKKRRK